MNQPHDIRIEPGTGSKTAAAFRKPAARANSFDFNGEQFLGSWDAEEKNILRMQSLFDILSSCLPGPFSESSKALTNRDFREFREQTGYGRDFYVYTPMEKIELSEEEIIYFNVQPGAPEE